MPYQKMPSFNEVKLNMLEIPKPGIGGLNLFDLEYEQETNQSPYMLNMMYRNGTFAKRYGQEVSSSYANEVYAIEYFDGKLIVHTGTQMLVDGVADTDITPPAVKGIFIKFYQTLIYYCNGTIYEYKYHKELTPNVWKWGVMEPYIPEAFTECQPASGGTYNRGDDFNLLTLKYKCVFNGDGSSTDYFPKGNEDDIINWDIDPVVKVDDETKTKGTDYNVDTTNKKIKFLSGHVPASGTDNVEITFTTKETTLQGDRTRLLASKYHINYGANGSSHLFLAGGGDAKLFYSDSYDHTYFPENNWIILGSTEDDIKGFGLQYNVLIAFKPKEIYSLYSYNITASMVTSDEEDSIGREAFGSQIVNSQVGCDAPYTIQLINNQLTWFNSKEGVCTLVSTNVADERNVRVLSRNINRSNNMGVTGVLDINTDLDTIVSVDYDYKYFICFPKKYDGNSLVEYGMCFMWDYGIAPYTVTSSKATDPKTLDWFLFDNFNVRQFLVKDLDLLYLSYKTGKSSGADKYLIVKLGDEYSDIDLTDITKEIGINSYYMTPFLQFSASEYLKTVKNIYIQCRGDTSSVINMYYYTDESIAPEQDPESIRIGGRIWSRFGWGEFQWLTVNWATTFRRKCNLKKIQMCAFYFENKDGVESVAGRDMSVTHLALEYQLVKTVR